MLPIEEFEKKYQVDYERLIDQGGFARCFLSKSTKNVVIRVANIEDYFAANLNCETARKDCLQQIRRVFDEWSSILIAQQTNAVKVEAFALKIVENYNDPGEIAFQTLMAMEPLKDNLYNMYHKKGQTMQREEYLKLVDQMLECLEFFEKVSLWHGDIKPHNIMKTKSGDFRLIDFGTARYAPHSEMRTKPEGKTEAYSLPEYNKLMEEHEVDRIPNVIHKKNDRFSVGMTLIQLTSNVTDKEMLLIRKMFDGESSPNSRDEGRRILNVKVLPHLAEADREILFELMECHSPLNDVRKRLSQSIGGSMNIIKVAPPSKKEFLEKLAFLITSYKIENQREVKVKPIDLENMWNSPDLQAKNIEFILRGDINDARAWTLGEASVFSDLPQKHSIHIDFDCINTITDTGTLGLSMLISGTPNLRVLDLHCESCRKITDGGFSQILNGLEKLPQLEQLGLHFRDCNLGNPSIINLEKVLSKKTKLNKLELDLAYWKLTDDYAVHFEKLLPNLKNVSQIFLNFSYCLDISDAFADKIMKGLSSMNNLTRINHILFNWTKVTKGMMKRLTDHMKANRRIVIAKIWGPEFEENFVR